MTPTWLYISSNAGSSGTTTITISAATYSGASARTASFDIETAHLTRTVNIMQETSGSPTPVDENNYLTFSVNGGSGTINFDWDDQTYPMKTIQYSKNNGEWTEITNQNIGSISVTNGDVVRVRGNNGTMRGSSFSHSNGLSLSVSGYPTSLLVSTGFSGMSSLSQDYCFEGLFSGMTGLQSASGLLLSAITTLSEGCYKDMFAGCSSLTNVPALPATTLTKNCYKGMFRNCALTSAPTLASTSLAESCYEEMFAGNWQLTTTPNLPAAQGQKNCYKGIFSGCTSLVSPATHNITNAAAEGIFAYMYAGCSSLTGVSSTYINRSGLGTGVYEGMFLDCTSLTAAPNLPSTAPTPSCYKYMFMGCTSLSTLPTLGAFGTDVSSFEGMFRNCASLVSVPSNYLSHITYLETRCFYGMFQSCTGLTGAPSLPATTMKSSCYNGMFYGCKSLVSPPSLPATTLAENCYNSMFYNCGFSTAPSLPATTLAPNCYNTMFMNCKNLTVAPVLSAATVPQGAYYGMFTFCSNLTAITCLAQDIAANNATSYWVNGVAQSGLFTKASVMTAWTRGVNGIPVNWTVQDHGVTPTPTDPELENYLTFTAVGDEATVLWFRESNASSKSLKVSWDSGVSWTTYGSSTTGIPLGTLQPGETMMVKGDNSSYRGNYFGTNSQNGYVDISGNIMSLINSTGFSAMTTLSQDYCFDSLFEGCYIRKAEDLRLPATTLTENCYANMFKNCQYLISAPALPATVMSPYCYAWMFQGCTSLATAPALPSETLANSCYLAMFKNCTSLTESPLLPADTLVPYCYQELFYYCTSMNKIYCAARNWSATDCLKDWVISVAWSGTFYESPNASGWPQGTSGIPSGWSLNTL